MPAECDDLGDVGGAQAFAQYALTHQSGGAGEEDAHGDLRMGDMPSLQPAR
jgi:hypothetical protein